MLPDNLILGFLIIFGLRVVDVSLGTIRTVYILQGRKYLASSIAFIEVTIFIYAISGVVQKIGGDNWILMFAYSGGFSVGTLVGVWLEEMFAMGYNQIRVITKTHGDEIAAAIRERNFGATVVGGRGKDGPVDMIFSIVPRKHYHLILDLATNIDPHSFVSVSDSRYLFRGYTGLKQKK